MNASDYEAKHNLPPQARDGLGIPCIRATCECGYQWMIALPPWEASWDTWTQGGYSNCKECQKLPKSFVWAGIQPLGPE